ncbi:alpha/beta hydrolase family protein [Tessaracoccus antarcticus]|uniref:S9 family peptidase n=1 Tax=Tessaracoccus antarcticus TaxID=2479848 RepID=A0A3M0G7B3_9ACTN|nr:prolyl oligopeptidase family serine peptidase [Tessaracoccus antarcticus]RMB60007.1 S9 family peptidase [Tessaracoccus antarcticus]
MSTGISIDAALTGEDSLSQVRTSGQGVHWLASIAEQNGRVTIRRWDGADIVELTPQANVRSRVMEYGGGAYDVSGDLLAYCDDVTARVFLLEHDNHTPLTPVQDRYRWGDLHLVPELRILVAVREDHEATPEARTEVVALSLDGDNVDGGRIIVTGADFYAGPRVHEGRLAWFQWAHPNMSWDSAEVVLCTLEDPSDARVVAGGQGISAQHPLWCCHGQLAWSSDETGFWNWYSTDGINTVAWNVNHDCDIPTWVLDKAPVAAVGDDMLATVEIVNGTGVLALWQPSSGGVTYPLPGTSFIESIASLGDDIFVVASWPNRAASLVRLSPTGERREIVGSTPVDGAVAPTSRWTDSVAGPVQSWFYTRPDLRTPPLVVMTHGGPTSARDAAYDRQIQFWVSRGFAVLDVNYSGSTGFGRAYRDRLKGQWGILDVADVVAAVQDVTNAGLADPDRVAITGGSAGGYTTLQALVTTDVFAAGISSYGIGDLRALLQDTHKAESRYPDSLIGPWPEAQQVYLDRSPVTQLENLKTPMLILQGLQDTVVPPNQAYAMAEAVRAAGKPLALVTFEGEGHGFRGMDARRSALESKVSFLQQVFGMEHSTDVPVLAIENLPV